MADERLLGWVRQQKQQGRSDHDIMLELMKQNYSSDEAQRLVSYVSQPAHDNVVQHDSTPMQKSEKVHKHVKTVFYVVLVIILLIGVMAVWYYVDYNKIDNDFKQEVDSFEVDAVIEVDGDSQVEVSDVSVTSDCADNDCFEDYFARCEPATVTVVLFEIEYFYEIFGPKDGGCEVLSTFLSNPNPDWVGKEMVCVYDNAKDFQSAVADMSNCEGELYTLMTGG